MITARIISRSSLSPAGPLLQVTHAVPIVFVIVPDPVGAGFVASRARPGSNATHSVGPAHPGPIPFVVVDADPSIYLVPWAFFVIAECRHEHLRCCWLVCIPTEAVGCRF
jgi:hypothetical protein